MSMHKTPHLQNGHLHTSGLEGLYSSTVYAMETPRDFGQGHRLCPGDKGWKQDPSAPGKQKATSSPIQRSRQILKGGVPFEPKLNPVVVRIPKWVPQNDQELNTNPATNQCSRALTKTTMDHPTKMHITTM